jgi:hypothetical protein
MGRAPSHRGQRADKEHLECSSTEPAPSSFRPSSQRPPSSRPSQPSSRAEVPAPSRSEFRGPAHPQLTPDPGGPTSIPTFTPVSRGVRSPSSGSRTSHQQRIRRDLTSRSDPVPLGGAPRQPLHRSGAARSTDVRHRSARARDRANVRRRTCSRLPGPSSSTRRSGQTDRFRARRAGAGSMSAGMTGSRSAVVAGPRHGRGSPDRTSGTSLPRSHATRRAAPQHRRDRGPARWRDRPRGQPG